MTHIAVIFIPPFSRFAFVTWDAVRQQDEVESSDNSFSFRKKWFHVLTALFEETVLAIVDPPKLCASGTPDECKERWQDLNSETQQKIYSTSQGLFRNLHKICATNQLHANMFKIKLAQLWHNLLIAAFCSMLHLRVCSVDEKWIPQGLWRLANSLLPVALAGLSALLDRNLLSHVMMQMTQNESAP